MANVAVVLFRIYELPWSTGFDDDQKFKQLARVRSCGRRVRFAVLGPAPADDRSQGRARSAEDPGPAGARAKQQPPPPPVVREEPKPEPEKPVDKIEPPKPKPEPVKPEPKPIDTTQQARDRAKVAGLLPLTNALQSLRDSKITEHLDKPMSASSTATRRSPSAR